MPCATWTLEGAPPKLGLLGWGCSVSLLTINARPAPSLRSGFRLRARTPAKRLNFDFAQGTGLHQVSPLHNSWARHPRTTRKPPRRAASLFRRLGCFTSEFPLLRGAPSAQDGPPGFERKLDWDEVPFRKEVVFSGFVNDTHHAMLARYTVRQSDVDFPQL